MKARAILLTAVLCIPALTRGEAPAPEAAAAGPRTVTYFANYRHDPTLAADLAMLMDACRKGHLTHVIVGLFHCDWRDRAAGTGACVSLNGLYLDDPTLVPLWEAVKVLQSRGIKVLGSFGGGGVGDYRHLLDPAQPAWYPELRDAIRARGLDGLDLDIEEQDSPGHPGVVSTRRVRVLVKQLRRDFGGSFLITSAPVASALVDPSRNVSPGIDYRKLAREGRFDWLNLQFYNGFGDLLGPPYGDPDYEAVLRANPGVSPKRFVAGVTTGPAAGNTYHDLAALAPVFAELARKHQRFGGVYGWTFQDALAGGVPDPVGWCRGVSEALRQTLPAPPAARGENPGAAQPLRAARYAYHELSPWEGIATAVGPDGSAAGWFEDPFAEQWHAFVAPAGGAAVDLGTLDQGHQSQAVAVGAGGFVAGWSDDGHYDVRAIAGTAGQPLEDLGTLGGSQSQAAAVNADGAVAGWSFTSAGVPRGFVKAQGLPMEEVGTLGGAGSAASALDDGGRLGGMAQDAAGAWRAFLRQGEGEPLSAVSLGGGVAASRVTALGSGGTAAGWLITAGGFDAFATDEWGRADLFGTLVGAQAAATGMNRHGVVVGWYLTAGGACRAFVKGPYDGLPLDLTGLADGLPPGEVLMAATAVGDGGAIAGQTLSGRAFVLTPLP